MINFRINRLAINADTIDVAISGKSCAHCVSTDGQCSVYAPNPNYCVNEAMAICSTSSSNSDSCEPQDVGEFYKY